MTFITLIAFVIITIIIIVYTTMPYRTIILACSIIQSRDDVLMFNEHHLT